MSSEVRHVVDGDRPYPLVRFSGVLDATTAGTVRDVLLEVLAGQPEAVVVEVGGLEIGEPAAVGVLHDIRRATSCWPATHLTLCDARAEVWGGSGWAMCRDPAAAFAALGEPRSGDRIALELEPRVGAARECRTVITAACAEWGRAELAEPACIVVTEMVNNVVAHAETSMIVLLASRDEAVSVAVRDRSTVTPSYAGAPVSPTASGGRGMLLIDAVASRWGSLALADGKVVWALVTQPGT
ncbi:anti-anti-sigma factor [Actinoplanes sp. KI2]|uniref:ATP-binding protein n=1 Tax=Actinoplanes sp. KI2 TaxID=2983315 RepID=UPI0021D5FAC7|nr:ATP-binding protein [Actinoplanes sp. KI2]MCU7724468.1 anti-anti-sigma factor [Actinoplanes sp. KI2]